MKRVLWGGAEGGGTSSGDPNVPWRSRQVKTWCGVREGQGFPIRKGMPSASFIPSGSSQRSSP